MSPELEHKLVKRFRWLYAGYGGDIRSEGLYFGLQHGDGWFDLIWMLSLALEEEYKATYPWYKRLYHSIAMRLPRQVTDGWNNLMKKQPNFIQKKVSFGDTVSYLPRFYFWLPHYPRASQIKEKYGTLRFYMTCETDKMDSYITVAEHASESTCETCGKGGQMRGKGWYYTACKEHSKKEDLIGWERDESENT